MDFITFNVIDGKILAIAGNQRNREMSALEELLRLRKMPDPDKLKDNFLDLLQLINK